MSIIIDPQWTFIDTLQAAWKAYPGGVQLGAPNRVRALERWANVVGQERAVSELDTLLQKYSSLKEAAKAFGMSVSTLSRIKRNFKAMPSVTPFSQEPKKNVEQIELLKSAQRITESNNNDADNLMRELLKLDREVGVDSISRLMDFFVQENIEPIIYESTLRQFLEISQIAGINVISRLADWIINTAGIEDVITVLERLGFDDLKKLNVAVELSSLKSILSVWRENQENDDEEFWQKTLSQNSFVFAQLFSFPLTILGNKAYLGGKSISNKGGNIVDFLCANNLTKNAALIEIKTPKAKLLGSQYRGDVYNVSIELSGSVIQVANYKKSLLQNYIALVNHEDEIFEAFNPKSIIIIGNIENELNDVRRKKSFELFRTGLSDVQIITYDELFGKVEFLISLLQGDFVPGGG
jgi:transcriptional regulator with XRE-family HTH domain